MGRIQVISKAYKFLQDGSDKRFNYLYGGASSGKSWSVAQYLIIEKLLRESRIGLLVLRRTKPEVRSSCFRLFCSLLANLGVDCENHTSSMAIYFPATGSRACFDGVDDVLKKKSIEGINYVWLEEATEFTHKEWMQLNIRCRAKNPHGINRIFATFNPEDPIGNAWLKKLVDGAACKPDSQVAHFVHTDNPFLSAQERKQIEDLANEDEEYNKIYRLGQWATPTHIIYTNWDIVERFPENIDEYGFGLDFGFNNPTALIKIGVKDWKDIYIEEIIYESSLTNPMLIELMGRGIPERNKVVMADSAEPARIEEIARAGFNVHGVVKASGEGGKNWIGRGIDIVKRFNLHISQKSVNVIDELRGYKWKMDKNGNLLEEPVKFKDHAMDALRYYLATMSQFEEAEIIELGRYGD